MSNPSKGELERRLFEAISGQERVYSELSSIVSEAEAAVAAGKDSQPALAKMKSRLEIIAAIESEFKQCRQMWDDAGHGRNETLDRRLQDLTHQVKNLLDRSGSLEKGLQAAKARLRPEISQNVIAKKMQRAYWRTPRAATQTPND